MLFSEVDVGEIVRALVTLATGGTFVGVGAWIISLIKERRRSSVVATSESIKRDRARLNLDQDRLDTALANQQRAYDDLYEKYLDLYKRNEATQDLLLKSEVERAIAVTKLSECQRNVTELRDQHVEMKKRIEFLEERVGHA